MEPQFIKQSDLPRPLERFKRNNKDSDPRYAQVTRYANGHYVTFWQSGKIVLDVLVWSIDRRKAVAAAKRSANLFKLGYPRGRTSVIVELGQ